MAPPPPPPPLPCTAHTEKDVFYRSRDDRNPEAMTAHIVDPEARATRRAELEAKEKRAEMMATAMYANFISWALPASKRKYPPELEETDEITAVIVEYRINNTDREKEVCNGAPVRREVTAIRGRELRASDIIPPIVDFVAYDTSVAVNIIKPVKYPWIGDAAARVAAMPDPKPRPKDPPPAIANGCTVSMSVDPHTMVHRMQQGYSHGPMQIFEPAKLETDTDNIKASITREHLLEIAAALRAECNRVRLERGEITADEAAALAREDTRADSAAADVILRHQPNGSPDLVIDVSKMLGEMGLGAAAAGDGDAEPRAEPEDLPCRRTGEDDDLDDNSDFADLLRWMSTEPGGGGEQAQQQQEDPEVLLGE